MQRHAHVIRFQKKLPWQRAKTAEHRIRNCRGAASVVVRISWLLASDKPANGAEAKRTARIANRPNNDLKQAFGHGKCELLTQSVLRYEENFRREFESYRNHGGKRANGLLFHFWIPQSTRGAGVSSLSYCPVVPEQ